MASKRKLKVYRTPIGFHDAYVAAPSQKAALEAWGSDHDLFARGAAEIVTDEALTEEPLSRPGVVVKRLRGTAAEQIAALPPNRPASTNRDNANPTATPAGGRGRAKAPPRPDRSRLEEAERTLSDVETRHRAQEKALKEKEAQLARERRELTSAQATEVVRLQRARDEAEDAYERAMSKWRE